jgi:hypothetical protein
MVASSCVPSGNRSKWPLPPPFAETLRALRTEVFEDTKQMKLDYFRASNHPDQKVPSALTGDFYHLMKRPLTTYHQTHSRLSRSGSSARQVLFQPVDC